MKRITHLALALGTVALLALLLFLAVGAQPAALADSNTIKVPDDYSTIQAAIDAATGGDEIWVASGVYTENLSITEGITLSGGWSDDFSTRDPGDSTINGHGLGRVISVTCPTSDTMVTIDGFLIVNGDASGLGVPEMPEIPEIPALTDLPYGSHTPPIAPASDPSSPAEQAVQLRAGLADLAARDLYPGGEHAYQAMLARLERVTAVAEEAQPRADASPIQQQGQSQQGAGSGGGIYSYNASLILQNNSIQDNVASQEGDGFGGAVYVAKAPTGGVRILSNWVTDNVATQKGHGMGGALYVSDAPGATIRNNHIEANVASNEGEGHGGGVYVANAPQGDIDSNTLWSNVATGNGSGLGGGIYVSQAPDAIIGNNDVKDNVASSHGDGQGGGIYVLQSSGAYIQDNALTRNLGSNAGMGTIGFGGGLAVESSPDVLVRNNQVEGNFANAGWHSGSGAGGGFYLHHVDRMVVRDNTLLDNVATLKGNGGAGGMYLGVSQNALVEDNVVTGNWGGVFQFHIGPPSTIASGAGGIGVVNVHSAIVRGNEIRENTALMYGVEFASATGGGIDGRGLFDNSQLIDNVITGNVACQTDCEGVFSSGGGVNLTDVYGTVVAGNTLADNTASLVDGPGTGGGLHMRNAFDSRVLRNRFLRNRGGMGEGSSGGGLSIDYYPPTDQSVSVDANLFLGNLGSPDPSEGSSGGAVEISGFPQGGLSFTNNVLAGGGGLELEDVNGGILTNNTLYGNEEIGMLVGHHIPALTLTNNIVVSHTVGISVTEDSAVVVSYTLWDDNDTDIGGGGTITHTHPVTGSPAFVDPSDHDYHLTISSAARDTGDPAGVPPAPDHDLDGVTRPQGMTVDIGAYEWQGHYQYLPLVMEYRLPVVGWAVGDEIDGYGTILHTTDGGSTWTRQGSAADVPNIILQEVSAVDAENAWVVGKDAILRTSDGGQTWEAQTLPPDLPAGFELQGIKALGANTVYAVGTPSVLLHTADGVTWSQMPVGADVPGNIEFQVVDAVDTSHVWAVGAVGARTSPVIAFYDGVEWHRQATIVFPDPNTDAFIGVSAIDPLHVWAVGGWGMPLVTTTDGGSTWQTSPQPLSGGDMNRVVAVNSTTGWTSGDYGNVKYTTDAGATWYDVSLPSAFLFGVTAMDDKTAWVVGPGVHGVAPGIIARTSDAQHWDVQSDPSWPNMNGISFVGARR